MTVADPRAMLERLIEERGEDYAGLSRLIGRNPSYVQQYIKRGTPRRLAEDDRRTLARYFDVPEEALGAHIQDRGVSHIAVPRLNVGASAGSGAFVDEERPISHLAFDPKWLRGLGAGDSAGLSIIRVDGDSMAPTLVDGDEILVDRADAGSLVREGIYVLRREEQLIVKRIAPNPAGGTVAVTSDNPAYPSWPDCPLASITIVGRVIWCGRKLG